jgi:hypothetical protein
MTRGCEHDMSSSVNKRLMRVVYKTDVTDDDPEYIGSFS